MKKTIKSILSIFFIIYFVVGAFLFLAQDNFLYFPTKKTKSAYKEKIFINENESVYTTVLNMGNKKAIIYFGGNAENVDNNAYDFTKIFKDYTVYLVKYRAYGKSTGKPTEQNLYSDALYIYDSIKKKYLNISIIGRSLGTGVATYLAAKRDTYKLALITPFDSIEKVAQKKFPIYPMSLLLRDKYNSIDRVSHIKAQTFILTAQNDQIIKKEHTENLVKKFLPSQVTIKVIEGENHNSISTNKLYYTLLKNYFNSVDKISFVFY